MKRLLLVLGGVFLITALGPVPSANAWWWHRHSNSNSSAKSSKSSSAKTPKSPKAHKSPKSPKQPKSHHEKSHADTGSHLYNFPHSVGWRRNTPGPAGAGAESVTK
jgi:hypothetical protein